MSEYKKDDLYLPNVKRELVWAEDLLAKDEMRVERSISILKEIGILHDGDSLLDNWREGRLYRALMNAANLQKLHRSCQESRSLELYLGHVYNTRDKVEGLKAWLRTHETDKKEY